MEDIVNAALLLEPADCAACSEQNAVPLSLRTELSAPDYLQGGPVTLSDVLMRASEVTSRGIRHFRANDFEIRQSYAAFHAEAEAISGGLRALVLPHGTQVLFQFDRSEEFLPAFWACILAGLVAVPLAAAPTYAHPNAALSRLQSAVELFPNAPILTGDRLHSDIRRWVSGLSSPDRQVISLTSLRSGRPCAPHHSAAPDETALLLLTSGSTGAPKAVQLTHRNIISRCAGAVRLNHLTSEEISLNWFPLDHVGGIVMFHIRDLFLTCEQIHAPVETVLEEPLRWLDWIERFGVTITWAPNFAFGLINDHAAAHPERRWDLSSLRVIVNAGEAIVARTARRFMENMAPHGLPTSAMHPAWGMSETSSAFTYSNRFCLSTTSDDDPFVSVGVPVPGGAVRIVDAENRIVPEGTVGRLEVSGPQVTPGYFANAAANAESFTADGWFRTGDLGVLSDGHLTITGREKDVIIINGANYPSHEIESVVEQNPGVEPSFTAACAVRPAGSDTDRLAVLFHPRGTSPQQILALTQQIRRAIFESIGLNPTFLLPVDRDEIPKTPIGKIQRSLVRKRLETGAYSQAFRRLAEYRSSVSPDESVQPANELERQVTVAWSEVLGLVVRGGDENFFELGGDSLTAAQIVSRLRNQYRVNLSVRHLFESPTPVQLAQVIERLQTQTRDVQDIVALPRSGDIDRFPLSSTQERLWVLEQWSPGSAAYVQPLLFRLSGAIDETALARALAEIVRRHEALRSAVSLVGDEAFQQVYPELPIPLQIEDLRSVPADVRSAEAHTRLNEDAAAPFDLTQPPLVRFRLVRMEDDERLLCVTVHHLFIDAQSLNILMQELASLYTAFVQGKPSPLADPALQYADYAAWQRQQQESDTVERRLAYWRQKLGTELVTLELPMDRPRPAVQTFRGGRQRRTLSAATAERLGSLFRESEATLFMGGLAAFCVLLHRYTGQQDIRLGIPVANRIRAEFESIVGFFTNTLVFSARIDGDLSFRQLLRQVRSDTLDALENQDAPFERLVEDLHAARDSSRSPLFQVMFQHISAPTAPIEMPGATLEYLELDNGSAKFDLTLQVSEQASGLVCACEYRSDLYDSDTIDRLLAHYETLLAGIGAYPDRPIASLAVAPEEERNLLVGWSQGEAVPVEDANLPWLFERQAQRTPDAVAVRCGAVALSYHDLDRLANRIAHLLVACGVKTGDAVGVILPRDQMLPAALLGVLKAGAAYLPIDRAWPSERARAVLEDSRAVVLLTRSDLAADVELDRSRCRMIRLDQTPLDAYPEETPHLSRPLTPDCRAYIISTSGSTGRPKGVPIRHAQIAALAAANRSRFDFSGSDVWTLFHSVAFDISAWEIWASLLSGACLVVVTAEDVRDPEALHALLVRERVTVLHLTPSALRPLLDLLDRREELAALPLPLRALICGGEALPGDLAQRALAYRLPIHNYYGPTESTVWSSGQAVTEEDARHSIVPIGRPIANVRLFVLDSNRRLAPIGVPGDLYIAGPCLTDGYWNRADQTRERFHTIEDPFDPAGPMVRVYKSGDRARWGADGALHYLGRDDDQVKIRGYRIETGEIEAALRAHADVSAAFVALHRDDKGEPCLVAYVVPQRLLTAAALRAFVKKLLPHYMLPESIVIVDSFPMTSSGKIDRQALPRPQRTALPADGDYSAPVSDIERQLQAIWEKTLDLRSIGTQANFFDIGGHSLAALRLFAQIEKLFGKRLPLATLFHAPTIASLAQVLYDEGWSPQYDSLVAIQPVGARPPLFCIHGAGGEVLFYQDLVRYLAEDQPVYGLQSRCWEPDYRAFSSVQEMAAHYLAEIRTVQSGGPYYLCGTSLGGMIAFEIAQQLHAAGERVALLGMIDAFHPDYPRYRSGVGPLQRKVYGWYRTAEHHIGSLRLLAPEKRRDYVRDKARRAGQELGWAVEDLFKSAGRHALRGMGRRVPAAMAPVAHPLRRAVSTYRPRPYEGEITIFRATDQPIGIHEDRTLGWGEVAKGGITVYDTPGYHAAIVVEPRVRFFAARLRPVLEGAQRQAAADCAGDEPSLPAAV